MKEDYEAKALAKAEAKGPKEVPEISLFLDSLCQPTTFKMKFNTDKRTRNIAHDLSG